MLTCINVCVRKEEKRREQGEQGYRATCDGQLLPLFRLQSSWKVAVGSCSTNLRMILGKGTETEKTTQKLFTIRYYLLDQ